MESRRGVCKPDTTEEDEEAAGGLEDSEALGLIVPMDEALDPLGRGARGDDHAAMADAVGHEQQDAEDLVRRREPEGDAQHGSHVRKGAWTESNAEDQPEDEVSLLYEPQ